MTISKGSFLLSAILLVIVSSIISFYVGTEFYPVEVEISPKQPDNALEFYVDYLESLNYTVTEQDLSTNIYETVDNFNEFLWLLEYGGFKECYVDYGKIDFCFLKITRGEKLWLQLDGVYWELRL